MAPGWRRLAARYVRASERHCKAVRNLRTDAALAELSGREKRLYMALALGPDGSPIAIQEAMFIPTLMSQASDEQKSVWLRAAQAGAVLGCYAQTEMAHGSDVQGLQTTARYNPATGTFVLDSPTLGSTKWWPAALGRTATHAIVHARLLVPVDPAAPGSAAGAAGAAVKDVGVKAFLVQLRDMDTHCNLPGIETGDIGATLGLVAIEEGFCRFDSVHIPRAALLAKYQRVESNGEYIAPKQAFAKRTYATMMFVRARMVKSNCTFLARAATITTRYCAVRRQFKSAETGREVAVLDYQAVQYRVLPWVAAAFAIEFTARGMLAMYAEMERRVAEQGDTSLVAETHAISSCLKMVTSKMAVDGIEELRRACGGHGYSSFSGLDLIYGNAMVNYTGEGEAYMIIQQTSRWLLKQYAAVVVDKTAQKSGYIDFMRSAAELDAERCPVTQADDFMRRDVLVGMLGHRAARLLAATHSRARAGQRAGVGASPERDRNQWQGIQAATAYGDYLVVKAFASGVDDAPPSCRHALGNACALHALTLVAKHGVDLVVDGYMTGKQLQLASDHLDHLCRQVGVLACWRAVLPP